ncbi:carboxypeptidase-like regulatory domain-containing protein [Corynebacterium sp. ES2794-CONJ1]|uniref:carboxypeptidase-like regulatory domain-containing protein n=1 Tax=Corynebacterium sp. ES2794-CONJ1 TaxID=2980553 RepID=UPI0021DB6F3E|nr:carboxypeptidase-like regulatory domain-containing protein [Corynebacterium sp. ES2794-CONJ1]MCU9519919.1 carboxypeptidase-like regulatory domain-containing protein [Corynebacterium sp. ES2794-CONJ1]
MKRILSASISSLLAGLLIAAPQAQAVESTTDVDFGCHLYNPSTLLLNGFWGEKYGFIFRAKVSAPQTVAVGVPFTYTVEPGRIELPATWSYLAERPQVTEFSRISLKIAAPSQAELVSVEKSAGGTKGLGITTEQREITIGGDLTVADDDAFSRLDSYESGGVYASDTGSSFAVDIPPISLTMKATQPGDLAPAFPKAADNRNIGPGSFFSGLARMNYQGRQQNFLVRCTPIAANLPAVTAVEQDTRRAVAAISLESSLDTLEAGNELMLRSRVTDAAGGGIPGRSVEFHIGGRIFTETTDALGYAQYQFRPLIPEDYRVLARAGGKEASVTVKVLPNNAVKPKAAQPARLHLDPPQSSYEFGTRIELSADLTSADNQPVTNYPVYFNIYRAESGAVYRSFVSRSDTFGMISQAIELGIPGAFEVQAVAGLQGETTSQVLSDRYAFTIRSGEAPAPPAVEGSREPSARYTSPLGKILISIGSILGILGVGGVLFAIARHFNLALPNFPQLPPLPPLFP